MSNTTSCQNSVAGSIVQNTTGTRVCGLQSSSNLTLLESCCNGTALQDYGCTQYCDTNMAIGPFAECISQASNGASILPLGVFCQDGVTGNNTEQISRTSAGSRRVASSFALRALSWGLLLSFVFCAQGSSVPALTRRQDGSTMDSCSIEMTRNYTTTRNNSIAVTGRFSCGDSFCPMSIPIDTGMSKNNRTINGVSAAEPEFDSFFERLETIIGRKFPAMSGVQLNYGFVAAPGAYSMAFTPYAVSTYIFCGYDVFTKLTTMR